MLSFDVILYMALVVVPRILVNYIAIGCSFSTSSIPCLISCVCVLLSLNFNELVSTIRAHFEVNVDFSHTSIDYSAKV